MSKNLNDKELKDQGNKLFVNRNYEAAIDCYTKAIMKNPSVPHYYTNRALCYLNQKRWSQAIQDSKYALERDPNLVKGHFYLGELKKIPETHKVKGRRKSFVSSYYIIPLFFLCNNFICFLQNALRFF